MKQGSELRVGTPSRSTQRSWRETRKDPDLRGVVIGRQGSGVREFVRVRKLSYGVGVERSSRFTRP